MKMRLTILLLALVPNVTFALRVINDSPMEISFYTYNRGDITYAFAYLDKKFIVKAGQSLDFEPHDKRSCKIQLWTSENGQTSQRLIAPGRIFVSSDVIIIQNDFSLDITPEGTLPLSPTVNSAPDALTTNDRILESQGFIEQGSITGPNGHMLILEKGVLKIKNPEGKAYYTFKHHGVKYVKLINGLLFLYKDGDNGSYKIIKVYGKYRPNAHLELYQHGGVSIVKNGFTEWVSNDLMPVKKGG